MTDDRDLALKRLAPFIGEWSVEASIPLLGSTAIRGRVVFEWVLAGQFVLQRVEVPHTDVPDSLSIIAVDPDTDRYSQHYFDSRGVVRVYPMTFRDGEWTLVRDSPDFSPLDFSQRFTGRFSDDGKTIHGQWEKTDDSGRWQHDFDLTYTKAV